MFRRDEIGLCCGSLAQADFDALVDAASVAGFPSVSMWPTLTDAATGGGRKLGDLARALADRKLAVGELDPLCNWLGPGVDLDDMVTPFAPYDADHFFRLADALGARSVNVIRADDGTTVDVHVIDRLGALCDRAEIEGLLITVEFMPWSPVASLADATRLVHAVGRRNCAVNLDTWHHFRSGGTVEELAAVDPDLIGNVQLNDVEVEPWPDVIAETSMGRCLPGQGAGRARAVLDALWSAGVTAPITVEVFRADLLALPARDAAEAIARSVDQLFDDPAMHKV